MRHVLSFRFLMVATVCHLDCLLVFFPPVFPILWMRYSYLNSIGGRLPSLYPEWSVARIIETGADAVKVLLYYDPDDDESINTVKHAFVERIGAECHAHDIPFFLEVVSYSDSIEDEKSLAFAQAKPEKVRQLTREFSRARYGVDVLKL